MFCIARLIYQRYICIYQCQCICSLICQHDAKKDALGNLYLFSEKMLANHRYVGIYETFQLHCDHALLKILKVLRGEKHTRVWKIHARLPQTQLTMSLAIWFCRHKRGWKFASVVSRLQMLKHKCLGCSHWLCSHFTCNSTTFHLPIWIHLLL